MARYVRAFNVLGSANPSQLRPLVGSFSNIPKAATANISPVSQAIQRMLKESKMQAAGLLPPPVPREPGSALKSLQHILKENARKKGIEW
jgi:hypothetical protein